MEKHPLKNSDWNEFAEKAFCAALGGILSGYHVELTPERAEKAVTSALDVVRLAVERVKAAEDADVFP